MSIDFERRVAETPPRIEQLRKLASIGIRSAVERDRFRTLRRDTSTHYLVDEFTKMIGAVNGQSTDQDVFLPFEVRHRMAIRVGVRPPDRYTPKTWSLKFLDTYFTRPYTPDHEWHASRSTYRFEWARDHVAMADRKLQIVGFEIPGDGDLDYSLEHFNVPADIIGILAVEEELKLVTEADCDDLIENAREYFATIEEMSERQ